MANPETQFLHKRNPRLHASQEVEGVVDYLRAGGESIPNEPADKISSYLGFLAHSEYVNDGILTGDQASIDRQIDARVIKAEDVPEGYFEFERRIAREQGHGDIAISRDMRQEAARIIGADQRHSLEPWAEYISSKEAGYPDWFKSYAFDSVVQMGKFNKEKDEFQKRSNLTTVPFPELSRGALSQVYSWISKSRYGQEVRDTNGDVVINEKTGEPERDFSVKDVFEDKKRETAFQGALKSGNFAKLYVQAIHKTQEGMITPEQKNEIAGSWKKYAQNSDPEALHGDLQGFGLDWCTATGYETATAQIKGGDFYVYYTPDKDARHTVPRVAIRMKESTVAEVRGVNADQELEPELADIASERLQDLPGGEAYIQKAADMKRLTALDKLIARDPEATLSREDVKFLYEIGSTIEGFGYKADPRVQEIRGRRDRRDHEQLKVLAVEHLRESFEASYNGYATVATQLETLSKPGTVKRNIFSRSRQEEAPMSVLNETEMHALFEAKLAEWQHHGVLDYVAERIITHGELHTPVARPNVVASVEGLKALANNFAKGQERWDGAYIYNDLYDAYTTPEELAQLSGFNPAEGAVSFSLIPNKSTEELGHETVEKQVQILADLRRRKPELGLKVPSVLDALTLWQTLRTSGDKLADSKAFDKTYIRHFNLEPKRLGGWLRVPSLCVGYDGEPSLASSAAEVDAGARLAVG